MSIVNDILNDKSRTAFSMEILPPLRGNSIDRVYDIIDKLAEFKPSYINITSHASECVYVQQPDGSHRKTSLRRRPGTVAVAAAIQNRYGITAVPHIICNGFTKDETEYALLDLNFLGIHELLLLRGDAKADAPADVKAEDVNVYASDLQQQVNSFNKGIGFDGTRIEGIATPFNYGMACYPEKHEESPNADIDLEYAAMKVRNGASYLVTQMFFDNSRYFDFVERCRKAGITVPIVPGIKPITKTRQMTLLPKVFRSDIPEALASELRKCTTDAAATAVGKEWCVAQCRELMAAGVPGLHFYTHYAADSVSDVCRQIF